MPGKMADQTLDQAFGLPEVLVAVSTSHLSCKRAGKTRTSMPVWDSSGESRSRTKTVHSLIIPWHVRGPPDQTLDQEFGLPEVLVAVSTSRLSCKGPEH
jgi:hypothetical protein